MTDARPRLSVIVPTHNTRLLTERCFTALGAACGDGCELILVDDASSDGTAEAVTRAHPGVRVVRLEGPQGFTAAANAGVAAASGEILWLLNSDTEVDPQAPDVLLDAFDRHSGLGVAGAALRGADGAPQWSGGRAPGVIWLFALASGAATMAGRLPGYRRVKPVGTAPGGQVDWVSGAALAIRREAWREAGPLDDRFRFYAQDVDLCLRVRDLGWQVMIVPGVRVLHHEGATIGTRAGAVAARYHPALLWTDLVRLIGKHSGPAAARRARTALLAGARLRVGVRRLAAAFVAADRRAAWRQDTSALAEACSAIAEITAG